MDKERDFMGAAPEMVPDAEGMTPLDKALSNIAVFTEDGLVYDERVMQSDMQAIMAEYDRMRRKLDEISEGKTVMIMSDADRAKPVQQLDDAALLAWVRPTLEFISNAQEKIGAKRYDGQQIDKLVSMNGIISLARLMIAAGAAHSSYAVAGASDSQGEIGDWKVSIDKLYGDERERMVRRIIDALHEAGAKTGAFTNDEFYATSVPPGMTLDGVFDIGIVADAVLKGDEE